MGEETTPTSTIRKGTHTQELPPEILGRIFQFTAVDREGFTIRSQLLDLCLVCKSWYDAALLEHQIWGRIVLNKASNESQSFEKVVASLNRAPAAFRAVKAKFGLECDCYLAWGPQEEDLLIECDHQVLVRLLKDGPTIHHFDMECWTSSCFERLCQAAGLSSGQSGLKSLKLTVICAWTYELPYLAPLRHSPALTCLELDLSNAFVYDLGPSPLDFLLVSSSIGSSLTTVSITFPARYSQFPDYITNFLSWCTNLESLTMTYADQEGDHLPRHFPTTTLPKLKTLSLWGVRPQFDPIALHYLRTPVLVTLTIRVNGYTPPSDRECLPHAILGLMQSLGVLSPASCTLHFLPIWGEEIMTTRMDSEELSGILTAVPSLRHLSLHAVHFDAKKFLDASRCSSAFTPALERLDLQRLQSEFQLQHILQFVKDRVGERGVEPGSQSVPGFRSLSFSHSSDTAFKLSETYIASPLIAELRMVYGLSIVRTVLSDL